MTMSATRIAVSSETKEILRQFGEKDESYNNIIRKLIKEAGWKRFDKRWNKILKMMSSFRWTDYNVFCNRLPYFPKAIPLHAKTIAKKDQKCAERVGNRPKPTKIGCRYKATDNTKPYSSQGSVTTPLKSCPHT